MELKDSGFSWIRKIPVNWEVRRVKQVFHQKKEKAFIDNPTILSLARDGVKIRDISTNEGQLAADYSTYNPVSKNDLLLNPMDLYSGDNCNISRVTGVISPAYVNLRNICQFDTPEFFNYYFKYQYWSMAFFAHGRGVSFDNRWTLTNEVLRNYPVLYPPVQEQKTIADYLDKECARIDNIVEKQRNIIEKLKEYKKSVITEAVTKGLNPTAPMKDSGIEWIGKIPSHWEIKKLKYITQCDTLVLPENTRPDTQIQYIDIGSVTYGNGINQIQDFIFADSPSRARRIVKTGDTIISTVRTYLRAIAYISDKYNNHICSTGFAVLTPNNEQCKKFVFYSLQAGPFISRVESISTGISYPAVTSQDLINIYTCIPPLSEQQAIADYLDQKCAEIDSVVEKREKIIDLLIEYKKSIIYECVTGKKEVA